MSIGFIHKGYETTSTTLSYCTYVLVKHPEEQQKLFDEISSFFGNASDESSIIEPNADNVGKLEYLDMFIKEY
jgi:cytochrome P450 family 4